MCIWRKSIRVAPGCGISYGHPSYTLINPALSLYIDSSIWRISGFFLSIIDSRFEMKPVTSYWQSGFDRQLLQLDFYPFVYFRTRFIYFLCKERGNERGWKTYDREWEWEGGVVIGRLVIIIRIQIKADLCLLLSTAVIFHKQISIYRVGHDDDESSAQCQVIIDLLSTFFFSEKRKMVFLFSFFFSPSSSLKSHLGKMFFGCRLFFFQMLPEDIYINKNYDATRPPG